MEASAPIPDLRGERAEGESHPGRRKPVGSYKSHKDVYIQTDSNSILLIMI